MGDAPLVLVLGASGYVGGRLVPLLIDAGYRVRCLARSPAKLEGLPWAQQAEVVGGDLLDTGSLAAAFAGVDVAYYLVHSMQSSHPPRSHPPPSAPPPGTGAGRSFAAVDRQAARNTAQAAQAAGVRRLVYLGGLGEIDDDSSAHLRSRAEVGDVLLGSAVPATVLRAAVVIGSGSASFEMLRHLVEKLPIMITPRWVNTRVQPIAIRDVLRYLVGVIDDPDDASDHVYDIGGPDVLTYADMMQAYARIAGLPRRLIVKVPLLTPKLSSLWIGLVTPVPTALARPLVESLAAEVVVRSDGEDIRDRVPGACLGCEEALRLALGRIGAHAVSTSWRDAEVAGWSPAEPYPGDPEWSGGTLYSDTRELCIDAEPQAVFEVLSRVGGDAGWPTHRWAWWARGLVDRLIGGVGLRRGRRDPLALRVGDAVDFWRVEKVQPPAPDGLLRLRAEMRLPGRAWLEWRVEPSAAPAGRGTRLRQRALFAPRGLLGRGYWWTLAPLHGPIFRSMADALGRQALSGPQK